MVWAPAAVAYLKLALRALEERGTVDLARRVPVGHAKVTWLGEGMVARDAIAARGAASGSLARLRDHERGVAAHDGALSVFGTRHVTLLVAAVADVRDRVVARDFVVAYLLAARGAEASHRL